MSKTGRNDPCPCGSGRKFKKCCQESKANRPALSEPSAFNPSLLAQQWLQSQGVGSHTNTLVVDHFELLDESALNTVRTLGRKEGDTIVFYRKKEWMAEIDTSLPGQLILTACDTTEADRISSALKLIDGLRFVSRSEDKIEPLTPKDKAKMSAEMLDFKSKFFQTWLDEPNQRLQGQTPRLASRSPETSKLLKSLLEELEAREAELPKKEQFSFRHIRAELGL